jgi:hypothetical protein
MGAAIKRLDDHEKRMRKVEGQIATWSGAGSTIGRIQAEHCGRVAPECASVGD